nr:MAG TPA: hypothetical protein [Caudoviricetes sp.]
MPDIYLSCRRRRAGGTRRVGSSRFARPCTWRIREDPKRCTALLGMRLRV